MLRWTSTPSATGYRAYLGFESRVYRRSRAIRSLQGQPPGGVVYYLARGLRRGGRYFGSVTAYNDVGESDFSNEREFVVDPSNTPRADAGPNLWGQVGKPLSLGTPPVSGVNYVWLQRRGPSVATLGSPRAARTTLVADVPGVYRLMLVAFNSSGAATQDTVRVVIKGSGGRGSAAGGAAANPTATPPFAAEPTAQPTATPTPSPTPD